MGRAAALRLQGNPNERRATLKAHFSASAGSLRAGQRAAAIMSLIESAKLNGHDPYRYLKDVLERLSTQLASRIEELLPHLWQPLSTVH
jgi:hypothetical protein